LRGVGFVDGNDPDTPGEAGRGGLLLMPVAFLARITDAHHTLARAAAEAGMSAPPLPASLGFNPYQSGKQAVDTTTSMKAANTWSQEAERVREEVKKRERENKDKVDKAAPVDIRPSAFWLSAGRSLAEVVREASAAADEVATDRALIMDQVGAAKSACQGPANFSSADKKRLADLSKRKVHEAG